MKLQWSIQTFAQLDSARLYQLLRLRVDVFIVEQACLYPELDGLDTLPGTLHILGYNGNELAAYARAMAPETDQSAPVKIGRVVVHPGYRQQGVAHEMMRRLLDEVQQQWPATEIFLSAQTQVTSLYASLGFEPVSEEYIEDGIAHIDMVQRVTEHDT